MTNIVLAIFVASSVVARSRSYDKIYFETDNGFQPVDLLPEETAHNPSVLPTQPSISVKNEFPEQPFQLPVASHPQQPQSYPQPQQQPQSHPQPGSQSQPQPQEQLQPLPNDQPRPSAPEDQTSLSLLTIMKPYTGVANIAVNSLAISLENSLDTGADVLVFSPLSIAGALSMILLGAGGQTLKELASVLGVRTGLHFGQDGTDLVHEELSDYFKRFIYISKTGSIHFANGVFIQRDFPISRTYERNAARLYDSEVHRVNFKQQGTLNAMNVINGWVANRTEGHLTRIISDPLPPETTAVFVNVIYFEQEWETVFCDVCVRWGNFFVTPTDIMKVRLMPNVGQAYFYEDKLQGVQVLGLPYKNSDSVMFFLLPANGPKNFLLGKGADDILGLVNKTTLQETIYVVPKMRLESTLQLNEPLKKMGLRNMFTPGADLKGISNGLMVDSVIQKIQIDVTETGTKAIVSTMISTTRGGHRPVVRLDKPFIFMIYHKYLKTISFWGTVYKPIPYEETPINNRTF